MSASNAIHGAISRWVSLASARFTCGEDDHHSPFAFSELLDANADAQLPTADLVEIAALAVGQTAEILGATGCVFEIRRIA